MQIIKQSLDSLRLRLEDLRPDPDAPEDYLARCLSCGNNDMQVSEKPDSRETTLRCPHCPPYVRGEKMLIALSPKISDPVPRSAKTLAAPIPEQASSAASTAQQNALPRRGNIPITGANDTRCPPSPIKEAAYYGLAGDFVRMVEPHTESAPVAILVQLLLAFGNMIGRNAYFLVEASKHYMNTNAVIVGKSAKARKGTSWGHVKRLCAAIDAGWADQRQQGGMSSGEGLIYAVRDPLTKLEPIKVKGKITGYEEVIADEGVSDKRLLVIESEIARTLKVMEREGNTLSALVRQAWDDGDLRVMTKIPQKATNAHISIIGHITNDELRRYLTDTEAGNGFANRFLWVYVERSKLLPEGGQMHTEDLTDIHARMRAAVAFAATVERMKRDEEAREAWCKVYPHLTRDVPGLLGSITSRADAQVLRLSCLYALLDQSDIVRLPHLAAALAVWDYCEESARFIFGDALGDAVADALLSALRTNPEGLTRKQISDLLGRNIKAERIAHSLSILQERGLASVQQVETGGRPAEVWTVADTPEIAP